METQPWPSAEDLDGWYADMSGSPVKDEIQRRYLSLPPHLLSTSLLGWAAIAEVAEALRLSPGDTMLDVACGRGGYGLEIAARTGARLVRVDFSAEAVRQACEHAWRLGRTAGLPPRESRRDRPGRLLGSTPCYVWTRSSSPSSQTPPTASYRRSLGPTDVRC